MTTTDAEKNIAPARLDRRPSSDSIVQKGLVVTVGIVGSCILIFGWGQGLGSVARFGNNFSAMVPSTAILLLLAAIALFPFQQNRAPTYHQHIRQGIGILTILSASANLAIRVTGISNGLDELFWPSVGSFDTDRMSEATSLSFLLLGVALLEIDGPEDRQRNAMIFATIGSSLALLALIVFCFDARSLSSAAMFSTMSLPTALGFQLLFASILINLKHTGWVATILGEGSGSAGLRRVLPLAVGLPIGLAIATTLATDFEVFDAKFQLSLLTLGSALMVMAVLLNDARRTNLAEQETLESQLRLAASEKKREETVKARKVAEKAAEAKTKFLANMSHEIRTPMNGILGFTELLSMEKLTPDQKSKVDLVHDSAKTMSKLLDEILDLSKIETGHFSIRQEPVEIHHIIKSCVRLFEAAAQKKGLSISLHLDSSAIQVIQADGLRIKQVLSNIIGNAVKFTDDGGIHVEAKMIGPLIEIRISDTGIGIAEEDQPRVFDEFIQVDGELDRQQSGTGLGLNISRKLVQLMGGELSLSSELGVGTTVLISLPSAQATPTSPALPQMPNIGVEADGLGWEGLRVAVAEDHDVNQLLIMDMLGRLGAKATLYKNGAEAVTGVIDSSKSDRPFDLLLMDVQMPVMNGLDAARELRGYGFSPKALPIVAMTANAFEADIKDCESAGMQAHLSKPLRFEALAGLLAECRL